MVLLVMKGHSGSQRNSGVDLHAPEFQEQAERTTLGRTLSAVRE